MHLQRIGRSPPCGECRVARGQWQGQLRFHVSLAIRHLPHVPLPTAQTVVTHRFHCFLRELWTLPNSPPGTAALCMQPRAS
jgi:hypothetical protein